MGILRDDYYSALDALRFSRCGISSLTPGMINVQCSVNEAKLSHSEKLTTLTKIESKTCEAAPFIADVIRFRSLWCLGPRGRYHDRRNKHERKLEAGKRQRRPIQCA